MLFFGKEAYKAVMKILDGHHRGKYPLMKGAVGLYQDLGSQVIAFDNRTEDCWVESFETRRAALDWLKN